MRKNLIYCSLLFGLTNAFCACSESATDEGIQTFKIDTEADAVRLTLDDYADYTLIPLETKDSALIGHVSGIKVQEGIMAVSTSEEQILFFDLKGNFLSRVSHKGEGPEDYIDIPDFKFTREGNVMIGSNHDALKVYDQQNRFLKSYQCTGYDFMVLGNEIYTYGASRASKGRIQVYSLESGDSLCAFSAVESYPIIDLAIPFKPCSDSESYYVPAFSDTIYIVKGKSQAPKYALDFGVASVKPDFFENLDGSPLELFPKLMEGHQVVSVEMFSKGVQYSWMQTMQFDGSPEKSSDLNIIPLSKSFCIQPDGQSLHFDKLLLKKYQNLSIEFHRLFCADGTHFACAVDAGDLMEYAETLNPEDQKAFMERLNITNAEQNPYILLVKSK